MEKAAVANDYGINETKTDNTIITNLSPRYYLDSYGIWVMPTCDCSDGYKLGNFEIRINPNIWCKSESFDDLELNDEIKAETMVSLYKSIWSRNKHWAFVKQNLKVRCSRIINPQLIAICGNLSRMEKISDKIDHLTAIESDYVIRLFYNTAVDCFADFKKIFKRVYEPNFNDYSINFDFRSVEEVVITEISARWIHDHRLRPYFLAEEE